MIKLLTFISLCAFFTISYSVQAIGAGISSLTTITMCIYKEKLESENTWEIYFTQDIPRNQNCIEPPEPVVLVMNHYETVSYEYDYSIGNIDYYSGPTSGGERCIITRQSIIVPD